MLCFNARHAIFDISKGRHMQLIMQYCTNAIIRNTPQLSALRQIEESLHLNLSEVGIPQDYEFI